MLLTEKQSVVTGKYAAPLSGILFFSGLYLIGRYNYLFFHTLAEFFGIVVAYGIFMIAWNSRRVQGTSYFPLVGIVYPLIGVIDLLHALTYPGINIFQGTDTNVSAQLWIIARYVESLALFTAALLLDRKPRFGFVFLVYAVTVSFLLLSIFYWRVFPDCFVEGAGLTSFKKTGGYIIALILAASVYVLKRRRTHFDTRVLQLLVASVLVTVGSELSFTVYTHADGLPNLIGHFLKIISFFLFYMATLRAGRGTPYNLLFRDLKQRAEPELSNYRNRLNDTAKERAPDLKRINKELEREIRGRMRIEKALRLNEARLEALLRLSQMPEASIKEIADFVLEEEVRLTGSTIGFIGFVSEGEPAMTIHAWSKAAMEECRIADKPFVFPVEKAGLWGEPVRRRRPIIVNDYSAPNSYKKGYPEGHVPITRFLGLPVFDGERVVAMAGVANKEEEYDESDVRQLTLLLNGMWRFIQRIQAEEELRVSETKFRKLSKEFHTLLDAIPDSILLLSPNLTVLWANRGAASLLEKEPLDITGRYCYHLWENISLSCNDCHAIKSFRTGKAFSAQIPAHYDRFFDANAFPIKNEAGKVDNVIMIYRDITEKITLQTEAMRAGHLASLGELAAGVAHEINNPINGIINYARILFDKHKSECDEKDISAGIMKEGNRIATIVKNLLSFASDRQEEKTPVHIHKILFDSLALTKAQIKKDGITLKVDIAQNLPEIVVIPQQIEQVFLNIVSNARYALNQKYAGANENKTIEIYIDKTTIDGGPYVRTRFHDRGIGIPADIRDKVINPFFSTKSGGEGTGLGLSISHGIITGHDGKLIIDSVEGQCTDITVTIPAKEKTDDEVENFDHR